MLHAAGAARATLVLVLMLCCSPLSGCGDKQAERVQDSWNKWVAANVAKDGPTAVSLMNANTISYYENIRSHAIESDAATVKSLPLLQRLLVLTTRVHVDAAYLRTLNGSQLLMVGTTDGWMKSAGDPSTLSLTNIQVDGDIASCELAMDGNPALIPIRFTKEDGIWKVDLSTLINEMETMLSQQMSGRGGASPETMNAMIPMMLAQQSGKKVGPEIWDKPKVK